MPIKHLSMPELHQIYDQQLHDDFPDNERRSFQNMLDYHEKGLYEAWAKYEDGICLAYSCFLGNQDGLIMDYFAVNKAYRNRGIGSAFLKECLAQYPDTLILIESEKDDGLDPLKKRRLDFYLKNGLYHTGVNIWLYYVDYAILANQMATSQQILAIYQRLYDPKMLRKYLHLID